MLATFATKVLGISERSTTIMLAVFSKLSYPYLLAMAAVVVEITENKQKKHILMILAIDKVEEEEATK
uniref:Potassium transporter n=1 Tax=Ascaris lumbricoides TaxID=6252 RepID=A0A0M3IN81_ASCLU